MEITRLYLEIVRWIHYIICSESYRCSSIKKEKYFSRNRKMSFTDYIYAILQNTKSSLQVGLNAFFEAQKKGQMEYSKQAFSKGRQRIKPEAFAELFLEVANKFYEKAELTSWNGYQLFGIDGSRLNLPCTDTLAELYGVQTSQGAPQVQALMSCVYDLLNGMITDVRVEGCKSSERKAAKEMIESFSLKNVENPVFIMDRGYPSAELIDAIIKAGHKFVMRCPTEFLRSMNLPEQDNVLEHKFVKLKHTLKLRVVKVPLSNGEIEYLATNIFDPALSPEDFKFVYQKRWGIETKYNDLKNKLEIENFSGYTPDAILQDLYATIFLANLTAVLEYDLHAEIEAAHKNPKNRYEYKMNIAMTISELKETVIEMILTTSRKKQDRLYRQMTVRLMRAVLPVRQGRSSDRTKKHKIMKFPHNSNRI